MKKLIFSLLMGACITTATSQIQTPKASPLAKVEQKVGLADISISYSRPSVRGRVIFGDVLPFGESHGRSIPWLHRSRDRASDPCGLSTKRRAKKCSPVGF